MPGLAEDWSFDEETLTYTFHLRKDLTFHDGTPLTSADVKFVDFTVLKKCGVDGCIILTAIYQRVFTSPCRRRRFFPGTGGWCFCLARCSL